MLIAGTALAVPHSDDKHNLSKPAEWRGWSCIIAGPILFIIFGLWAGMVPATFACVLVCALGDRTATLKGSLILAAGVTTFGALLFAYLLKVPFPLIRWGFW
jgi:hypothetical protein